MTQTPRARVVVVNALALSMFPRAQFTLRVTRIQPGAVANAVANAVERLKALGFQDVEYVHYIRHPATLETIRRHLPGLPQVPNAGLYIYKPGDVIVVVALKAPQRGQEVQEVREEDLDIALVEVL